MSAEWPRSLSVLWKAPCLETRQALPEETSPAQKPTQARTSAQASEMQFACRASSRPLARPARHLTSCMLGARVTLLPVASCTWVASHAPCPFCSQRKTWFQQLWPIWSSSRNGCSTPCSLDEKRGQRPQPCPHLPLALALGPAPATATDYRHQTKSLPTLEKKQIMA